MKEYNFKEVEKKWQKIWEESGLHKTDFSESKNKLYVLEMFSYPSGNKLHNGHWYNYAPSDTWARFKKMQGFNIFHPMGFDAFGLPAENFAIKTGVHPKDSTDKNTVFMTEQLKQIGATYDWEKTLDTSKENYYKWTQWLFLQLYKKGLAYKANAPVNWCPKDKTVLANEQVINGTCERCGTQVIRKKLSQWFFKITDYAEELLEGLEKLDWPEKTKKMQFEWIGKSIGSEIEFKIKNSDKTFKVFTTRPDTLLGATYCTLAPEHELAEQITTQENLAKIKAYKEEVVKLSELDRLSASREKTGVFTGAFAINPINNEEIPIWISDYVLVTYGTGAVMAVPAHDERDFEFAKVFGLPIRKVILQKGTKIETELSEAYTENGTLVNSHGFDGMESVLAKQKITETLKQNGKGEAKINYRLRDWLVSRQRYWGSPIPIVNCEKCGEVAVCEKDLPVTLPYDVEFTPDGDSPLAKHKTFKDTTCPNCNGKAIREVDTLDTFICSSWYYLRYPSVGNDEVAFDFEITKKWLPVDRYVGGAEHATKHLLYARFVTKALRDLGFLGFDEPFLSLTHQGTITGADGRKMSKSLGNVINPEPYVEEFGSDVFRVYLMFNFAFEEGGPWEDSQVKAINKFIKRLYNAVQNGILVFETQNNFVQTQEEKKAGSELYYVLNNSLSGIWKDTEKFHFNTAIARMMELVNEIYKYFSLPKENQNPATVREVITKLVLAFAPFAPHLSEEMWRDLGNTDSIFKESFPKYDESKLQKEMVEIVLQVNGKIREKIEAERDLGTKLVEEIALSNEKIKTFTDGKQILKVIVVPNKLVNIVVR
ncbi:leucine--tRNA ligase [bacterium]|nr:leucine--tRNA ligase [bacterium]